MKLRNLNTSVRKLGPPAIAAAALMAGGAQVMRLPSRFPWNWPLNARSH